MMNACLQNHWETSHTDPFPVDLLGKKQPLWQNGHNSEPRRVRFYTPDVNGITSHLGTESRGVSASFPLYTACYVSILVSLQDFA